MSQARQSAQIKARTLASIVGRIISMGLAFGPISRFMIRSLYAVLESRCAWCEMLTLSSEAREELSFWSSSLGEYNSQPIWHTPLLLELCILMAALEASQLVSSTLDKAGFIAHPTKSIWQPTQRLQWLGFVIDVELGQIEVPPEKLALL